MKKIFIAFVLAIFLPWQAFAAVGCDLNDPDRDVKRFFPSSTGYKTQYMSIKKLGGKDLLKKVEKSLGDPFKGLYETDDVPYTVYSIFKGDKKIGYIHGVNQKGKYGAMQVFFIFDKEGTVKNMYFQKLTSKASKEFKAKKFTKKFIGLSLKDFKDYNPQTQKSPKGSKVSRIKNPLPGKADLDFKYAMRGAKKNFILMDVFVFNPHVKKGEK